MVMGSRSGFSWNATTLPLGIDLHDAELVRFRHRDRQAGDGRHGVLLVVEVRHLTDVHLVDVVGAEDQDGVGAEFVDQMKVLKHRVGGPPVPLLPGAHLRRDHGDELTEGAAGPPGPLHVLRQRLRFVLGQDVNRPNSRVRHVGQDEVDDAVPASEGNGGFGAVEGQRVQAGTFPACHDQSEITTLSIHVCRGIIQNTDGVRFLVIMRAHEHCREIQIPPHSAVPQPVVVLEPAHHQVVSRHGSGRFSNVQSQSRPDAGAVLPRAD